MRKFKKGYFTFNRTERYGIAVLIIILAVIIVIPFFTNQKTNKPNSGKFSQFQNEITALETNIQAISDSIENLKNRSYALRNKYSEKSNIELFPFNPNDLPPEKWEKLGLRPWQIKVIKNFESKGGVFYSKNDFKKMYCISESEYETLEPYIVIPEKSKPIKPDKPNYEKPKIQLVELNSADSATLTSLPGIGGVFATRIIKYKNLLGGFANKEQLLEIYGFNNERFEKIKDFVYVNPESINKIDINKISVNELKKHPYLDYYSAKSIIDQRVIIGRFDNISQIKDVKLVHADLFEKIKPYIKIN